LLDATSLDGAPQRALMARFPDAIQVFNKSDVVGKLGLNKDAIPTVATAGSGIDRLRSAIRSIFQCEPIDANSPKCWTSRQREMLRSPSPSE